MTCIRFLLAMPVVSPYARYNCPLPQRERREERRSLSGPPRFSAPPQGVEYDISLRSFLFPSRFPVKKEGLESGPRGRAATSGAAVSCVFILSRPRIAAGSVLGRLAERSRTGSRRPREGVDDQDEDLRELVEVLIVGIRDFRICRRILLFGPSGTTLQREVSLVFSQYLPFCESEKRNVHRPVRA